MLSSDMVNVINMAKKQFHNELRLYFLYKLNLSNAIFLTLVIL